MHWREVYEKRFYAMIAIACMLISGIPVFAKESVPVQDFDVAPTTANLIERSNAEQNELAAIYQELYPDQYHYIENYQENGITNIPEELITLVFYDSKTLGNATYDLTVYSNGQVFLNYVIYNDVSLTRGSISKSGIFKAGDLNKYISWVIYYTIDDNAYDSISRIDYEHADAGIYYTILNKRTKMKEDSSSPAYIGYTGVSLNNGAGPLYDLGVAVGNNQAKSFSTLSSGGGWFWAFFYQFFGL